MEKLYKKQIVKVSDIPVARAFTDSGIPYEAYLGSDGYFYYDINEDGEVEKSPSDTLDGVRNGLKEYVEKINRSAMESYNT